ncbi:hypothetical protein CKA32_006625 [Geitlerinema sp. FC II]|nr:hypothetical protein CKA32_006625 [Geitlerinema sp. FC II]
MCQFFNWLSFDALSFSCIPLYSIVDKAYHHFQGQKTGKEMGFPNMGTS